MCSQQAHDPHLRVILLCLHPMFLHLAYVCESRQQLLRHTHVDNCPSAHQ